MFKGHKGKQTSVFKKKRGSGKEKNRKPIVQKMDDIVDGDGKQKKTFLLPFVSI